MTATVEARFFEERKEEEEEKRKEWTLDKD